MIVVHRSRHSVLIAAVLACAMPALAGNTVSTWAYTGTANVPWATAANWTGGTPVSGVDTELVFGGSTAYQASNNISDPFTLNRMVLSDTAAGVVTGSPLAMGANTDGVAPQILQNSAAGQSIWNQSIALSADLTYGGTGTGGLTQVAALNGAYNVTQNGNYTLTISGNSTISGRLTINRGGVQVTGTAGAFRSAPITVNPGAMLTLGNNSAQASIPDRLGDTQTLTTNGGAFTFNGQAFNGAALNAVASETLGQLSLAHGYSTITTSTATGSSGSALNTTLNRAAGTTAFVRGSSLGGTQKITFSDTSTLKGGGGGAGTTTISIYPWMVGDGTNAFAGSSGNFVTHDANGLRVLNTSTEYKAYASAGATDNAYADAGLTAGDRTVNSLRVTYGGGNIGAGKTLTVASGGVAFANDGKVIGYSATDGAAGTLSFGSAEGIIFAISANTNTIRSVIAGSNGMTKGGTGTLVLGGINIYSGQTTVDAGILQVGDGAAGSGAATTGAACLGSGDLEVADGATLLLRQGILNGIADTATVSLRHDGYLYGKLNLETGINETVGAINLGGVAQAAGTYGSTSSLATFRNDSYFSGTGIVTIVPVPEPAMAALLGAVGLIACGRRSRAR